ncbi:hypothetical protein BD410DRAFT_761961 [Rickenella mellea]|uniref:Arrestin-like N-terminal domain-containing protein n=1 Tax=Rickenella mellea TaxID=50990 RepID=A0A4Y7QJ24_9AGAM|nr:hypothetical protein BD410DRAFT_761961 [Rickenella mellea]
MESSVPPPYSTELPSSPPYSSAALGHGEQLHPQLSQPTSSSSTQEYVYGTPHLELNLGPKIWGTPNPSYGRNASVEGVVTIKGSLDKIIRATARLEGKIVTLASERGLITSSLNLSIVSVRADIYPSHPNASAQYSFSLPFPTYVSGKNYLLPPTCSIYHPGITCDITYELRIDLTRKGMRRHETIRALLNFLPRSYARAAIPTSIPCFLGDPSCPSWAHAMSSGFKVIQIEPKWTQNCEQSHCSGIPRAFLTLPAPTSYPATRPIPLSLTILCPNSPALTKLLLPTIRILLVRRSTLWVDGGRRISKREVVLGGADIHRIDESREGASVMMCELCLNRNVSEISCFIEGVLAQQHIIRISLRPPSNTANRLPAFHHDELVELTTDSRDGLGSEHSLDEAQNLPALSLTSTRGSV